MSNSTISERVAAIRALRRERKLPIRHLAELAGLPPSTIQEMDGEDWNPTVRTLAAVEAALLAEPAPDSITAE